MQKGGGKREWQEIVRGRYLVGLNKKFVILQSCSHADKTKWLTVLRYSGLPIITAKHDHQMELATLEEEAVRINCKCRR